MTTLTAKREVLKQTRDAYRGILEIRERKISEFDLREVPNGTGGTDLLFRGYACVTEAEYEMEDFLGPWIESVERGAFAKTLAEAPDVQFRVNHQGLLLARTKSDTLKLSEDGVGLLSEARLDPKSPHVIALRSAVDRGDLDEMSFAFRVMRQEWDEDYERRWIKEVNLDKGDVSPVNFGANPATGGTVSIRSRTQPRTEQRDDQLDFERLAHALKRLHAGGKLDLTELRALVEELEPAKEPEKKSDEEPSVDPEELKRMKAEFAPLRKA